MKGWIFNLDRREPEFNRFEERDQQPIFYNNDKEAVFEVWFYHHPLKRWFVMASTPDLELEAQGVVFFQPDGAPEQFRERMHEFEETAGLEPDALVRKRCQSN